MIVPFGRSASAPGCVLVFTKSPVNDPTSCPVNPTNAVVNDSSGCKPSNKQLARVAKQSIDPNAIDTTTIVMTRIDVEGMVKFNLNHWCSASLDALQAFFIQGSPFLLR